MLEGRQAEQERIGDLLARARAGTSGSLVVRGDAGIGKTALLQDASVRAAGRGFTVLRARGVEAESELAYAGVADLVRPVLDRLDRLPAPQAAALRGVLALAPPAADDRFAAAVAVQSLLGAAAADAPLLVVVDDLHWLDRASATAVLFAARRPGVDRVAFLLGARDDAGGVAAGLDVLPLRGLPPAAARAVLARAAGRALAPHVAAAICDVAGGNPLALTEIPSLLTDEQLAGEAPLPDPLPPGAGIERAFLRRTERLPAASRTALVVAAACDSAEAASILDALRALGLDVAALEAGEDAGLIALADGRIAFRHPLLRSTLYHGAAPAERRQAHRALADVLAGAHPDRSAWHLAAATIAPDESVAVRLEHEADAVRLRTAFAAAARLLERAAELSPDPDARARRLLAAAEAAQAGGELDAAETLLAGVVERDAGLDGQVRVEHLRGRNALLRVRPREAVKHLERAAAAADSRALPGILLEAGMATIMIGDTARALAMAEQALGVDGGDPHVRGLAALLADHVRLLRGERAPAAFRARLHELAAAAQVPSLVVAQIVGMSLVWLEEYEPARVLAARMVARGRESSPDVLPFALALRGLIGYRTGDWTRAHADSVQAVEVARQLGQAALTGNFGKGLVDAARGHAEDARSALGELTAVGRTQGVEALAAQAEAALGLLELGATRPRTAAVHLGRAADALERHGVGNPNAVQARPDLVEAYVRLGRFEDAAAALDLHDREVEAAGSLWGRAAGARCRGLLARGAAYEREFGDALDLHDETSMPFERARTELCLGERHRRNRRRAAARRHLAAALEVFEGLEARPWFERARTELAATGEVSRSRALPSDDGLTAQERRVALLVADGATNKEAAAALFLSPKTVETHLSNVYRKLELRSRSDLARVLARQRG